ncbi:hypothetical protein AB9T88_13185, partial [Flavobacterium sp. LBUM151]
MKLFGEQYLKDYLSEKLNDAKRRLQFMNEVEFKSKSKENLLKELVLLSTVNPLKIDLDNNRTSEVKMREISGSHFPNTYDVHPSSKYPRALITYTYLFSSNSLLMGCIPSNFIPKIKSEIRFSQGKMFIEYQTLHATEILSDKVVKEAKNWILSVHDEIHNAVSQINKDIENYNMTISEELQPLI